MGLRRAKLAVVPSPAPAPNRPPAGYDARTVAEAAEILRHQTLVLGVRSRVAAAAGGLPPVASHEPAPPQPEAVLEPLLGELRALRERLDGRGAKGRERELAAREAAVEKRARQLAKAEEALAREQSRAAERERALQERTAELDHRSDEVRRAE